MSTVKSLEAKMEVTSSKEQVLLKAIYLDMRNAGSHGSVGAKRLNLVERGEA
jgi:hypothetical protein